MEQTERTRSIKVLLIWKLGGMLDYYRIIDPSKEELYLLNDAHGKELGQLNYLNSNDEKIIHEIGTRLGVGNDTTSPNWLKWTTFSVNENTIKDFMGWDRIYVTGLDEDYTFEAWEN